MAWVSGFIRFNKPPEQQSHFKGDIILKKATDLVLHGVITMADSSTPVPGALVKIFARSPGGREVPISQSYSGGDGRYLLSINKNRIPAGTASIIIRAAAIDSDRTD